MDFLRSITAARHRRISTAFAACLIVLVVVPFTAPFAVCDIGDLFTQTTAHSHSLDDGKPMDCGASRLPAAVAMHPCFDLSWHIPASRGARPDTRPFLTRVLRI